MHSGIRIVEGQCLCSVGKIGVARFASLSLRLRREYFLRNSADSMKSSESICVVTRKTSTHAAVVAAIFK